MKTYRFKREFDGIDEVHCLEINGIQVRLSIQLEVHIKTTLHVTCWLDGYRFFKIENSKDPDYAVEFAIQMILDAVSVPTFSYVWLDEKEYHPVDIALADEFDYDYLEVNAIPGS